MSKENMTVKEKLEIIDELLVEYMKLILHGNIWNKFKNYYKKSVIRAKQKSRQLQLSTKEI